jgi:mRNA interferase RelE/StbE
MMANLYELFIESAVHAERKSLPGHIRQIIKRTIEDLAHEPRPHNSRPLDTMDLTIPEHLEIRRMRIDKWRLIYAINETEGWVWIWGLRKRPPYDYEDLDEFIALL